MTDDSGEDAMKFEVLKVLGDGASARLGRLTFPRRKVLETPDFFSITSRGVVPHITPDNLSKHVQTGGVYMGLEDFVEMAHGRGGGEPPIYKTPPSHLRPLHAYTAMPPSTITVLGGRRFPAVASPMGNHQNAISIFTSTGFAALTTADYESATETLRPDIAIPLADIASATGAPKPKRALRMAERTEDWVAQWFERLDRGKVLKPSSSIAIFAPVLPVPYPMQWEHLNRLAEDHRHAISGLAIYDTDILSDLKDYSSLLPLPRLALDEAPTPQHILRQISLGVDIFLIPFLNAASDSGIALTFTFPAPPPAPSSPSETPVAACGTDMDADTTAPTLPLGIDMASPAHRTSLSPLFPGCACYACTHHHRAYVNHLLAAREMLGWTLLQIHNHRVLSDFFAGARAALAAGTLSSETARFGAAYQSELPPGTGSRPRARGYHFKSEAFDEKRNKPVWGNLGPDATGDAAGEAGSEVEGLNIAVDNEVERNSVPTPVVPDVVSVELDKQGFAKIEGKEI